MYSINSLNIKTLTELKSIAKELKIKGYSTFKKTNKDDLIKLIIEKQKNPTVVPTKPKPTVVPTKPKPTVTVLPKVQKVNYTFDKKDLVKIDKTIIEYKEDIEAVNDLDNVVTPNIILNLIKTDDKFLTNIHNSLKGLYNEKIKRYTKLKYKLSEAIKNDQKEKNILSKVINDYAQLDKMFPMILTNQVLLTKIEEFINKLSVKENSIESIKQNLLDAINDENNGILSISGDSREFIRNQLAKTIYILSKGYQPFMDAFINMIFTGPAGVGKTRLANSVAFVYKKIGILINGEVLVVSPKDLVGEYIGQTGPKTAGVLMKGLESIVFIDEAYQIMPCEDGQITKGTRSFGPEAITEIVNFLDKFIGLFIMIVAGYEREMKGCFLAANEGLNRRFPIRYDLPPYSVESLLNIFMNTTNSRVGKNLFDEEIAKYIYSLMISLDEYSKDIFKNQAGDMLNLSTLLMNNYYGSYNISWTKSLADKKLIIDQTFNQFLRNKGYAII